ncbi:5-hydroxytryptamine receptor 7-like [Stylophora pistillata]|uniref:5-hydroxytryptamine receptor 7-like n=1 Tax=Stylophora pistillata TaxID=50429 RepID=UPI000C048FA0|nr:5-hydroxytryptamine receptor 7-like [Stylophora pistillata]
MEFYVEVSLGVISVVIVAVNSFVVCLVCLNKVPRTYTNWLTVSLAVSDILTGGILFPTLIIGPTHVVVDYLISMILLWGVANICALTYDRFIAVIKPLQYTYRIPDLFKRTVIAVWLFPTMYSLLPLFWRTDYSKTIHLVYLVCYEIFGVIIPYICINVAYFQIFKVVKRSLALRKNLDGAVKQINENRRVSSDAQVAKVFWIISVAFFISWFPIMYMTTAEGIFNRFDIVPNVLQVVSLYTVAIASLVNPFVYAFFKPDFRIVSRNICRKSDRVRATYTKLKQAFQAKTDRGTKSGEEPRQQPLPKIEGESF